jgi:hypothetical protein
MEIRRSLSAVSLTALFRNELGALNGGQMYCNLLRSDQTLEHIPAGTSLKSPRMCVRQLCLNSFCKRRTASYRSFVFPSWGTRSGYIRSKPQTRPKFTSKGKFFSSQNLCFSPSCDSYTTSRLFNRCFLIRIV